MLSCFPHPHLPVLDSSPPVLLLSNEFPPQHHQDHTDSFSHQNLLLQNFLLHSPQKSLASSSSGTSTKHRIHLLPLPHPSSLLLCNPLLNPWNIVPHVLRLILNPSPVDHLPHDNISTLPPPPPQLCYNISLEVVEEEQSSGISIKKSLTQHFHCLLPNPSLLFL